MTVHVYRVDDVVDPLTDFDKDATTTEELQSLQLELESDINAVDELIEGLKDWYFEAHERVREIDDALVEREADESEETVQVETTA